MNQVTKNILVVRNDKLGDFMLSLPCFAALKSSVPKSQVSALVPGYTAEIATLCPWIDHVQVEKTYQRQFQSLLKLIRAIRANRIDAAITLFSTTRVGLALLFARVQYRLAPSTKLAQIFYNHRLTQRRSRSEKPEYVYNLDLIRKFLSDHDITETTVPEPPYLLVSKDLVDATRAEFCEKHNIDPQDRLVFLHSGSGGSANNLSLEQFADLAASLRSEHPHTVVLTTGPGEEEKAHALSNLLSGIRHVVYYSTAGLIKFAQHVACADLFIAGSTGPLHIAGALNVPTAAFYPRRRSATALRWQTLNSPDRRLAFSPPEDADESDMQSINVHAAALTINRKFLNPIKSH